jgi:hypothetical protein
MKKEVTRDALNEQIARLQDKQAEELEILKEQFYITYESLKPINLVKNTLQEITTSPGIKDNLLNNAIGLVTGYISKKVLVGSSHNPIKRILGTLFQFAIANVVSKHSETIKSTGEVILKRIFRDKNDAKNGLA